jgi:hypothetical protein
MGISSVIDNIDLRYSYNFEKKDEKLYNNDKSDTKPRKFPLKKSY